MTQQSILASWREDRACSQSPLISYLNIQSWQRKTSGILATVAQATRMTTMKILRKMKMKKKRKMRKRVRLKSLKRKKKRYNQRLNLQPPQLTSHLLLVML